MTADNPVLYTIPAGGVKAPSLPTSLKGALSWRRFWSEVKKCGPVGATRWQIRKDPHGALTVIDLATGAQREFANLEDVQVAVQDRWLVEPGDNLVILHIDERDL